MKIVQVNTACNGSIGKIAHCISQSLNEKNIENYVLFFYGDPKQDGTDIKLANKYEIKLNALKSRILGNYGFNSSLITKRIIKKLDELNPDIIHIHNIHGHDANIEMLCDYLADKKVIWTLHDCWLFTGYCPYYTFKKCEQWKTECHDCPVGKKYSWITDQSKKNFERKKRALLKMKNLTLVTPSIWLKKQVEESFLKDTPLYVIPNGIDIKLFDINEELKKKQEKKKKLVLCVGMPFGFRKGINDVVQLSEILPDEYQIMIIGSDKTNLSPRIYAMKRTENQEELMKYYNQAYVLLNPTHEDNYPTVNLEAIACGTPVITYNVGGSPEAIDENTGIVVEENNIESLKNAIMNIKPDPFSCRKKAEEQFSDHTMTELYYELYETIIENKADPWLGSFQK